jgi:hypothetical protein
MRVAGARYLRRASAEKRIGARGRERRCALVVENCVHEVIVCNDIEQRSTC